MNHKAVLFLTGLALSSALATTAGATAQAQWPVKLGETSSIFVPPTFGDIDGDGIAEVITVVANPLSAGVTRQGIYAYRQDGSEVLDGDGDPLTDGVFKRLTMPPGHTRQPVTLGELNSNPGFEIFYYGKNTIEAVQGDGSDVPGWPLQFANTFDSLYAPIVIADVDRDGFDDVIFTSGYDTQSQISKLHVVDRHGVALPGWPVQIPRAAFGVTVHVAVVGDFAGASGLEIVVGSNPTTLPSGICCVDSGGALLWSYPVAAHDLVAGDMTRDGRLDLVAVEVPRVELGRWVTGVVVLNGDGRVIAEQKLDLGLRRDEHSFQTINNVPNVEVERQTNAYIGAHPFNENPPDVLFLGHVNQDRFLDAVFSVRFMDMETYGLGGIEFQYPTVFANEGHTYALDPTHQQIVLDVAHSYVTGAQISWMDKFVSADRLVDLDGDKFQEVVTSEIDYLIPGVSEVTLRFWDHHGQELLSDVTRSTTPETGFVLEPVLRRATFGELAHGGRLDFALNMRRGELHRKRASFGATGPARSSGEWPVYRQNNQRTGVQSARY
ncbi:MAG TPA: hypothetical protein VK843_08185 [Planctomycetota bacterium]|nr:hypothetical protein [Planctomycetota bacterium]